MSTEATTSGAELLARASAFAGTMSDLAQLYAEAGVPVFPCHPDSKRPLTPHSFRDRSDDPELLQRWWQRWPDALVGLVPVDVGLAALDVDSTEAAIAARDTGLLTDAVLVVETGGKSQPFAIDGHTVPPLHVYIPTSDGPPKTKGLVIRYDKGYVIAPGSRRPSGRAWRVRSESLGAWAVARSETAGDTSIVSAPLVSGQASEDNRDVGIDLRAPDLDRVQAAVARIPNLADTSREEYVRMAHMIRGATGPGHEADGLEMFRDWAAKWTGGPIDPAEDERVYRTIVDGAVRSGWPHLHRLAAEHGYDNQVDLQAEAQAEFGVKSDARPLVGSSLYPQLIMLRDKLDTIGDPVERQSAMLERLGALARDRHLRVLDLRELLESLDAARRTRSASIAGPGPDMFARLADAQPALARGFLYSEQQHVLFGEPASFKTFVALDLALSIASGRPWVSTVPTRRAGVVFFAGEAAASVHVRIAAWAAARGLSPEDAQQLPFALVDEVPRFGHNDGGVERAVMQVREAERLRGMRVELVGFDNLTRILGRAGFSNTDVGEFGRVLAGLDEFARQLGVATLTIAHSPLSDSRRPSGTFQGLANPDFIYQAVREDGDGPLGVTIRTVKSRGARPAPALVLSLVEQDATALVLASLRVLSRPVPAALTPGIEFTSDAEGDSARFSSLVVEHARPLLIARGEQIADRILALLTGGERSARDVRREVKGTSAEKDRAIARLVEKGLVVERRGKHAARLFSLSPSRSPDPTERAQEVA